ncbi:MAG TPA: hypothetical protein VK986_15960 [Tepidisphaeraceae bacterium]|nr:hypothetical protein [Tepidisphaeraceae bacterium]
MPDDENEKRNPDPTPADDEGESCPPSARVPHMGETGAGNPNPASRTGGAASGVPTQTDARKD